MTYIYIYIYIHIYIYIYSDGLLQSLSEADSLPMLRENWSTGILDYILPKTPGYFRKSKTKASCRHSWKTVAPVDFRRKPEPAPCTQVLSYMQG